MKQNDITDMEMFLRKELTNLIVASGANNYRLDILANKKYISKKKLRTILKSQRIILGRIEDVKNKLLEIVKS